jgi:hypothetical protein
MTRPAAGLTFVESFEAVVMPPDARRQLVRGAVRRFCPRGFTLFARGTPAEHIW